MIQNIQLREQDAREALRDAFFETVETTNKWSYSQDLHIEIDMNGLATFTNQWLYKNGESMRNEQAIEVYTMWGHSLKYEIIPDGCESFSLPSCKLNDIRSYLGNVSQSNVETLCDYLENDNEYIADLLTGDADGNEYFEQFFQTDEETADAIMREWAESYIDEAFDERYEGFKNTLQKNIENLGMKVEWI